MTEAEKLCLRLMERLELEKRIDFDVPEEESNPELSTDCLFSESRGQMFGILLCESGIVLKAFSGQYNGILDVHGWAPPIPNPEEFAAAVERADPAIKKLTAQINSTEGAQELVLERRELSRRHMAEIHGMYTIRNFSGAEASLFKIFDTPENKPYAIPAGTGDCCAPKLLNQAVILGLRPVDMAEFFWGRENRSKTRLHGKFYPPCSNKCLPLLEFMLRGTDFRHYGNDTE